MNRNTFIFIFLTLVFFSITSGAFAISISPTPTPNQNANALEQQINNLKDRIASRVAQLNLVEKRGIIGTVTDVTENQITITDTQGNMRFIDVDELTKFSSPSAKTSFGISDITKKSMLGALGLWNKDSRRLLARFVDILIIPQVISGGVSGIDSKNFNLDVLTADGKTISVDVENITKTSVYTKTGGLTKAGFSKIALAERITIIGFLDKNNPTHIIASRIIIFPELPLNPKIIITKPENADITPSTGSGKILTPLTH